MKHSKNAFVSQFNLSLSMFLGTPYMYRETEMTLFHIINIMR